MSYTAGTENTFTLTAASDGAGDLVYTLPASGETLISGLAFDAGTRALRSTTSIAETTATTYTLTATDANGVAATLSVPLVVIAAPTFAVDAPFIGWFGHLLAIDYTLPRASGGVAPIGYSVSGDLPDGLVYDSSANRLHGTTSRQHATSATLSAVDANGARATLALSFQVIPPPNINGYSSDNRGITFTVGVLHNITLREAFSTSNSITYELLGGVPSWIDVTRTKTRRPPSDSFSAPRRRRVT